MSSVSKSAAKQSSSNVAEVNDEIQLLTPSKNADMAGQNDLTSSFNTVFESINGATSFANQQIEVSTQALAHHVELLLSCTDMCIKNAETCTDHYVDVTHRFIAGQADWLKEAISCSNINQAIDLNCRIVEMNLTATVNGYSDLVDKYIESTNSLHTPLARWWTGLLHTGK
jgi:hypothetical protein